MMDDATKKKVLTCLRKIAGQVGGIARMVEEDRYCVDVLGETGKLVLCSHGDTGVSAAIASGKAAGELMQVFSRYGCMGAR